MGLYCHTPCDGCLDDADCRKGGDFSGYCGYDPDEKRWACGNNTCMDGGAM